MFYVGRYMYTGMGVENNVFRKGTFENILTKVMFYTHSISVRLS